MAKIVKVLSETSSPNFSSLFILTSSDGITHRFKITAENYNCNCKLNVYIQTANYDFAQVAFADEIPGFEVVHYFSDDSTRIKGNAANIEAAKKFIENVF